MKLQIEKWVDETKPFKESDSAYDFFEESVRCYKIGAYKSAFIMSYLSFKTTIRYRILECTYGKELVKSNPVFWENEIITKLKNDDIWENYLNTIVEASCADSSRKNIAILHFANGGQVKSAYNYWKDIRNDCAHAKNNVTIDSSTVECFWNYLIDNLSKFYVLGGEEYLSRELVDMYKYYSFPEIVQPSMVHTLMNDVDVIYKKNSGDFFQKVFENLTKTPIRGGMVNDENKSFWKEILESSHENVRDGIVKIISNNPLHFFNFYKHFPKLLEMSVSLKPKIIVNDLSEWLSDSYNFRYDKETFWVILVEILDRYKGYIDIDRIVTTNTIELIAFYNEDERGSRILNANDVFKKYIFEVSSWFFITDAGSQYDNFFKFHSEESKCIDIAFNHLEWDRNCIETINKALLKLNSSMTTRTNQTSIFNGMDYKSRCTQIICNNKDKIETITGVDLNDYSEVSNILNSFERDKN